MDNTVKKHSKFNTRQMVRVSVFGVVGFILLMYNVALPIFPSFIKLDVANLPGIVAALTMGPMAGVAVEFVKNLVKALFSETIGIGEVSNFICGVALVLPLGIIYRKMPNVKGYILGSVAGVLSLCVIASLSNYFVMIPAYALAFGGMDAIVNLASKANASISDLGTIIVFAIMPFNMIKGILNVVLGYGVYRLLRPALRG